MIDLAASAAFALADHQICHIYLNDPSQAATVASAFAGSHADGVATVAPGTCRATLGLDLSLGTVTDGLKHLVPLFEPVYEALVKRSQGQTLWHADETRWLVFVTLEGKVGHRLDALSRDEDQFARIFRPIRAAVVIGVKMLDLEARARQLVVQLETKETAHLERVHQALLAPLGVGDVVDELDALDLIEPVSRLARTLRWQVC